MDKNSLYGAVILGLLGFITFFYVLEATIVSALKKFKKWEQDENGKTDK